MSEEKKEVVEKTTQKEEIIINNPLDLRPKELPLIVELPKDASEAQKQYAKVINAYAYQNPDKFATKKEAMLEKLKSLKNVEVIEETNLKINKSSL